MCVCAWGDDGSAVGGRAPGVRAVSGALDLGQLGLQAALCVCVCVCVRACGSALEPLCTHRNVAPLGSPSCPGSTWKWPPGKGKGGEERGGGKKKKKKPRASNPPSPNPASDKGQFIPSLSRGGKGGGPDKPGSLRPPPEPRGCARAGKGAGVRLPVRTGTGASPSARGSHGGAGGWRPWVRIGAGATATGSLGEGHCLTGPGYPLPGRGARLSPTCPPPPRAGRRRNSAGRGTGVETERSCVGWPAEESGARAAGAQAARLAPAE